MTKTVSVELLRISVQGVVQGVGFRPFVYQLATKHGLKGWVFNTSGDVRIEVEGDRRHLERFLSELQTEAPPLARIESIAAEMASPAGHSGFEIRHSLTEADKYQLVCPDIATCDACSNELFSPQDRRYGYPFTNCTNCGPRFTIIEDIPYDRPLTTMRSFKMCLDCQGEYDDPLDRRFHAQPNACPECGPSLELLNPDGSKVVCDEVIATAAQLLKEGGILAVKGLGGFHLVCDGTSEAAVHRLRRRKNRPFKPLAVMMGTVDEVKEHCQVSAEEAKLLSSPECPIVLLRWRDGSVVCAGVGPGLKYLGVMLPYTPLHHILLKKAGLPLVMTSGNLSEEPIAKDNGEALERLGDIADYFVVHDREIYARYDDSVAMVEGNKPRLVRRARGYAPYPVLLPFTAKEVLACGAELKNTFCLTRDSHAFVSQHIGDMENVETLEHFESTVELYKKLFRLQPRTMAHDLHPEYLSTKYAKSLAGRYTLVGVQHHHAHIVACMAENGVREPVIGVAFDGTGYGSDGAVWGGEFLLADYRGFRRSGHLEYVPMPGGVAAIKRPYRMALSYLYTLLGRDAVKMGLPWLTSIDPGELETVLRQIERGVNSPQTSSCGRLFDGVSALIGLRGRVDYEAQAAVELEMAVGDEKCDAAYPFAIIEEGGTRVVKLGDLFEAIVGDVRNHVPLGHISAKFHNTVSRIVVDMCRLVAEESGVNRIALSGGVFQNRLLLRLATSRLEEAGFQVFNHSLVPANDGGISLGQAVIANFAEGAGDVSSDTGPG